MIVPKGSMWRIGLSVNRPARLAVSSPKARATAPCDTSCRITEGTSATKSRISNGGDLVGADQHRPPAPRPAMIQMVVRGLEPWRRGGPDAGGGPQASLTGWPDQCFAAQLMQ